MSELLKEWRESATYWQKHSATIRTMFAPVTQALIEAAGIKEGDAVLDVAGGPGEPSLTIAELVGPEGSVTCTDAVAGMVVAARDEAARRGITNIQFRQCVADALPFKENFFDATVCRLGAMFFPDVVAGLREMLRVTKPGQRLAFAVWGRSELNPFSYVVTDVMSRYVETPLADPDAPGAFRFAEPGKLAAFLVQAGAREVRERELLFRMEALLSRAEFWELRAGTSGTLRDKLARLPEDEARRAALEVQEAVREFFPDEQMSFPAQMLIVSGTKNGSQITPS